MFCAIFYIFNMLKVEDPIRDFDTEQKIFTKKLLFVKVESKLQQMKKFLR